MVPVPNAYEHGRRLTKRLVQEMGSARQSWSIFEAINGPDDESREALRDGVNHLGLQRTFLGLVHALVRDTILTLMRVTDTSASDTFTLCKISALLRAPGAEANFVEASLFDHPDLPAEVAQSYAASCGEAVKFLTDLVPNKWTDMPPLDTRLYVHRGKMRPIRDKILAHAGDSEAVAMPVANEIREFLALTSQLVQSSQLIFLGSAADWSNDLEIRQREAMEFWDVCETGFASTQ